MILHIIRAFPVILREAIILVALLVCLWLLIKWVGKAPMEPDGRQILIWLMRGFGVVLIINFILACCGYPHFHLFGQ